MLRQYGPQRFKRGYLRNKPVQIGTIPIGSIIYIQDNLRNPIFRNPWIVQAWHPREIGAARKVNGKYQNGYVANGGHLATVKSLRDGRTKTISDCWLLASEES